MAPGRLPRIGAHDLVIVMIWGLSRWPELLHTAGFFFVMLGVSTIFEKKRKEWMGQPVVGPFGSRRRFGI